MSHCLSTEVLGILPPAAGGFVASSLSGHTVDGARQSVSALTLLQSQAWCHRVHTPHAKQGEAGRDRGGRVKKPGWSRRPGGQGGLEESSGDESRCERFRGSREETVPWL